MRDSQRLRDRVEVRLERMQLIWLTLGVVVALAVVFALGILVGKRAARLAPAGTTGDPIARIDENGALHEELTFYDKLTAPDAGARGNPRAGERAARPAVPRSAAAVPAATPAPYAGDSEATPRASPAQAAAPSAPAAAAGDSAGSVADGAAAEAHEPTPSAPPSPRPAGGSSHAVAVPAGADPELLAELARGPAHRGEYTVQVSSFQTADEAKAFAASLERKGYRPFVVAGQVKGKGTWYRVRLGSFKDPERAKSAKLLLAHSDIPAWVLKSE